MTTLNLYESMKKEALSLGEKKDCAVRAVAIITNTPYKTVRRMMAQHGRRSGTSTQHNITRAVLKDLGVYIEEYNKFTAKTVKLLEKQLPSRGRFLVQTAGHILPCVDGKVLDWTKGRRHRLKKVYRVSL